MTNVKKIYHFFFVLDSHEERKEKIITQNVWFCMFSHMKKENLKELKNKNLLLVKHMQKKKLSLEKKTCTKNHTRISFFTCFQRQKKFSYVFKDERKKKKVGCNVKNILLCKKINKMFSDFFQNPNPKNKNSSTKCFTCIRENNIWHFSTHEKKYFHWPN